MTREYRFVSYVSGTVTIHVKSILTATSTTFTESTFTITNLITEDQDSVNKVIESVISTLVTSNPAASPSTLTQLADGTTASGVSFAVSN
ncbi:MAG: hypothetical protein KAH25_12225 [Bacteroidales bacterium]|nr:hypothetical protein [Bacteroidales bacterium]